MKCPGAIDIRLEVVRDIVDHARGDVPNECCGLLIGSARRVERARRARNVQASPTRYLVDPADHFAAIRSARTDGLRVVGAYHSHPASAPLPSPTDLRDATYPDYIYVIISPRDGGGAQLEGYRLRADGFDPVALRHVP